MRLWIVLGPKTYTFKARDAEGNLLKTHMRVKGFQLNYTASQVVNFDSLRRLVQKELKEPFLQVKDTNILCEKDFNVVTKTLTKQLRVTSNKRVVVEQADKNLFTVPYGFWRKDAHASLPSD